MKKLIKITSILSCVLALTACADTETTKTEQTEQTQTQTQTEVTTDDTLTDVTVILDYVANTNHTGMYVALEQGFYEELGLNVLIIEPTSGATATLIATGVGDIGISYQEDVTMAKASSEPLPIKAIATILQHNTSGFSSHVSKNITSVSDFEGKTYAGWGGAGEAIVLQAIMEKHDADFNELDIVITDGSGMASLEGNVDLLWTFYAWDNILADIMEIDVNYMPLSELDERLDYYTPVIITSENHIENNPEMLSAFLDATTKGYEFAIENPTLSAEILYNFTDGYDLEMLVKSQEYLSTKYIDDAENFGVMQDLVWDRYTEFLLEYGMIEFLVESADCYTNEFLNYEN